MELIESLMKPIGICGKEEITREKTKSTLKSDYDSFDFRFHKIVTVKQSINVATNSKAIKNGITFCRKNKLSFRLFS